MSFMKEASRRGAPIFFSAGVLFTACGPKDITTNLVDCKNGPRINSTAKFLKEGEEVLVAGQPLKATQAGRFEIVYAQSDSKPDAVEFDPDEGIIIRPKTSPISRRHEIYTVSAEGESKDGIPGTLLTIRADCDAKK